MKCKYIELCPSMSGWCLYRNGNWQCKQFIEQAIEYYKTEIKNAEYVLEELKNEQKV